MTSHPLIAEQLSNYRCDDLFNAAEDARATRVSVLNRNTGRSWSWLAGFIRLETPANLPAAQPRATGGRALRS